MRLKSAEILGDKGIEYRLIELKERALSIEDVIRFSKAAINIDEICKTMILKDREGGRYAVLLLGSDRVDYGKANEAIGEKVSIASFAEVKEAVGVDPHGVGDCRHEVPEASHFRDVPHPWRLGGRYHLPPQLARYPGLPVSPEADQVVYIVGLIDEAFEVRPL